MSITKQETSARGNQVDRYFLPADRYKYDFGMCNHKNGWVQYDTDQDAWYFGVWVHPEKMQTFTYAEGDTCLVTCISLDSYKAELADMAEFYGPPPPAMVGISMDGQITEYYDIRPS